MFVTFNYNYLYVILRKVFQLVFNVFIFLWLDKSGSVRGFKNQNIIQFCSQSMADYEYEDVKLDDEDNEYLAKDESKVVSDKYIRKYDYVIKMIVIGDASAGKSCIAVRFAHNEYSASYMTTIGIDFKIKALKIQNKIIKLQLWDTVKYVCIFINDCHYKYIYHIYII